MRQQVHLHGDPEGCRRTRARGSGGPDGGWASGRWRWKTDIRAQALGWSLCIRLTANELSLAASVTLLISGLEAAPTDPVLPPALKLMPPIVRPWLSRGHSTARKPFRGLQERSASRVRCPAQPSRAHPALFPASARRESVRHYSILNALTVP